MIKLLSEEIFFLDVLPRLTPAGRLDLNRLLETCASPAQLEHFLSEHEVDLFLRDSDGATLLHRLAVMPGSGSPAALIRHGLDPDARDLHGRSALHLAAAKGRLAFVCELLFLGANAKILDAVGNSPLDLALKAEAYEVAARLCR
jgi:ankyrin repeat protein